MFNFRLGGILALLAFILSFLVGIVSRSTMPMLIIRPFVFAIIFFAIAALVNILINRFLPELLEEGFHDEERLEPGSRIDITDDGSYSSEKFSPAQEQAGFGARPDDSEDGLGDISDLTGRSALIGETGKAIFSGIDQNTESAYNKKETSFGLTPPGGSSARKSGAGSAEGYNSEEALPDLDSMAGAFVSESSQEEPKTASYSVTASPYKKSKSAKAPAWSEDFDAKEMAAGLRTILSKKEEG